MKNKTLQEQYNLIKEGQGNKDVFLREAKRQFPKLIRNAAGLNEAVAKLKTKSIISEGFTDVDGNYSEESWETKFKQFVNEAKADHPNDHQFDYSDKKNLDNHASMEVLRGIEFEAKKAPEKTIDEIKGVVVKNLQKDPLYYMNNALFGIEGLGAKQEEAMAASGKYAASGYGDKLTKLVKEALSKENEAISENFTFAGYMQQVLNELNEEDVEEVIADVAEDFTAEADDKMPMDEDEEEDAKNDADYEAGWTDDPRFDEGEKNEITNEVEEEIEKEKEIVMYGKKPMKKATKKKPMKKKY
jgi:hypothetical protein